MICLHGLGSNKASFFETVAALTPRAHRPRDRPARLRRLGRSPPGRRYNAPWFAEAVLGYMDAMAIDRAHLVGNSMGGRIALEVASRRPGSGRVAELSWRRRWPSAGAASSRRSCGCCVRSSRRSPTRCAAPGPRTSSGVCSRDPERLDPAAADVAVEEFCRIYRSRAARVAFFAAARNIYLDEPYGEDGF